MIGCVVPGCENPARYPSNSLCDMHYVRKRRGSDMLAPKREPQGISKAEAAHRYNQRHPERVNERTRKYNAANPDRVRRWWMKARYGLTPQEYAVLQEEQDGLCALCYEASATQVDHNHETGQIRGLLCKNCNTALGKFRDDPERLRVAVDYLEGVER